jgi:peptidyl-prolyl cis-trans isomerase-like 1
MMLPVMLPQPSILCASILSQGTFVIELYHRHTPRTCYNIAALAHAGYYDGVTFHRIVRDQIIQGGDPTGTGRGGESIYGGKFEDEITRNLKHTGAGVCSMANAGPNTNGSQFFITLKPTPWLDNKHTIFGRIYRYKPLLGILEARGFTFVDCIFAQTLPNNFLYFLQRHGRHSAHGDGSHRQG